MVLRQQLWKHMSGTGSNPPLSFHPAGYYITWYNTAWKDIALLYYAEEQPSLPRSRARCPTSAVPYNIIWVDSSPQFHESLPNQFQGLVKLLQWSTWSTLDGSTGSNQFHCAFLQLVVYLQIGCGAASLGRVSPKPSKLHLYFLPSSFPSGHPYCVVLCFLRVLVVGGKSLAAMV
jgi:hypothetical protein